MACAGPVCKLTWRSKAAAVVILHRALKGTRVGRPRRKAYNTVRPSGRL